MINVVKISNRTRSDVALGDWTVPAQGSLNLSVREHFELSKDYDLNGLGLSVSMRNVSWNTVSVRDFGAKGDGVSDDTFAIQSAIDYVAGIGGGDVHIPSGVYVVKVIVVLGNISLTGDSKNGSVIKARPGTSGAIISIEGSNVNVSKLRVVMS